VDRLGPYVLLERIASGGIGEIFRAKKQGSGGFEKLVAVKCVRPELARSAERIQDLIDEAKLAARLTHGNIAQTLDLLQVGELWVVVQEYVDGVDLFQLARTLERHERRLGLHECAHVVKQVLLALDFVHRLADEEGRPLGVVHCDIAPANIMVNVGGEVKLIDFGTARGPSLAAVEGRFAGGKVRYRAPEQVRGHDFDHRADLYSTGIVLWELLAGERIYEAMELEEILSAVAQGAVPEIREVRPDVPEGLAAVIRRATHPEPSYRYPAAAAFLRALEDQPLDVDASKSRHVLGEIAAAVRADARPSRPPPRLVSVAEDRSLEDSLVDALDP
jgi:serine/threonine protein kinase